jgi:hypothetical protein
VPTYEELARFRRQFERLARPAQQAFLTAMPLFVAWLAEHGFDPTQAPRAFRLHKLEGHEVWSISFGDGMRAAFTIGKPVKKGEVHIVWEFIGTHNEYDRVY